MKLSNQPCETCATDTMHRHLGGGMQCIGCGKVKDYPSVIARKTRRKIAIYKKFNPDARCDGKIAAARRAEYKALPLSVVAGDGRRPRR